MPASVDSGIENDSAATKPLYHVVEFNQSQQDMVVTETSQWPEGGFGWQLAQCCWFPTVILGSVFCPLMSAPIRHFLNKIYFLHKQPLYEKTIFHRVKFLAQTST